MIFPADLHIHLSPNYIVGYRTFPSPLLLSLALPKSQVRKQAPFTQVEAATQPEPLPALSINK